MDRLKRNHWIGITLYLIPAVFLFYFSEQDNFGVIFFAYTLMFGAYIYLVRERENIPYKHRKGIIILFHLLPLFVIPPLSPDIFRFIWDGELLGSGINPYSLTPNEVMELDHIDKSLFMQDLFDRMTPLSRQHYSPYPPFSQLYFFLAALISNNLLFTIIIIRLLILLTMVVGYRYLIRLLKLTQLKTSKAWILAINPFLIIEFTGNLHFEAVMLTFLFIAFYFVFKNRLFLSGLNWAVAISVKLTPLILIPALYRFIRFRKAFLLSLITGILSLIFIFGLLWPQYVFNVLNSIELYFNNFAFNGSFYDLVETAFYPLFDYRTILIFGPLLAFLGMILILLTSFMKPINSSQQWLERMMWVYMIYLLLTTTVHPWYILIPFGFSLFTNNVSVLIWTYLIMFSYSFYGLGNSPWVTVLTILEYGVLFLMIVFDLRKINKPILKILKW
ncbi:MAG: hypothetical protein R3277_02495 [Brumimicrobium sp.]|nr:hypothetical protein [Brumimicrobium sp.]